MVEGARLERVYTGNRIEGSNPSPSANRTAHALPTAQDASDERLRLGLTSKEAPKLNNHP